MKGKEKEGLGGVELKVREDNTGNRRKRNEIEWWVSKGEYVDQRDEKLNKEGKEERK